LGLTGDFGGGRFLPKMPEVVQQSVFPLSETRNLIPLAEVARLTDYSAKLLRSYAKLGFFEARQAAPGRKWYVERQSFERWYAGK
jgi:hypothetical protein